MRPHHGMTSEVAFSVVPDGDSGAGLYVVVCDDESVRPFPDAGSGRELPVGSNLTPAVTDAAEGASEQE